MTDGDLSVLGSVKLSDLGRYSSGGTEARTTGRHSRGGEVSAAGESTGELVRFGALMA